MTNRFAEVSHLADGTSTYLLMFFLRRTRHRLMGGSLQ